MDLKCLTLCLTSLGSIISLTVKLSRTTFDNHILPKYYSQIVQYYEMCKHAIYTRVQTNSSYVYISKWHAVYYRIVIELNTYRLHLGLEGRILSLPWFKQSQYEHDTLELHLKQHTRTVYKTPPWICSRGPSDTSYQQTQLYPSSWLLINIFQYEFPHSEHH